MPAEQRTCQSCKTEFVIEPEDFDFYKKISVPPPTWCPECRLVRRMAWRNERSFYKRKCDLCGKSTISMYSGQAEFPVFCQKCWWSDNWNPPEASYDPGRLFFEQFDEIRNKTPHEALQAPQCVNCEYANFCANAKNSYLSSVILGGEYTYYSRFLINCRECFECDYSTNLEKCFRLAYSVDCYGCIEGRNLEKSQNALFCAYSLDLSDCYGCINLRHKKYCIFNQQYSKEEYTKKVAELRKLPQEEQSRKANEFYLTQPLRGPRVFQSPNSTGEEIYHSSNCKESFVVNYVEDCRYCFEVSSLSKNSETMSDTYDGSILADSHAGYEMLGGSRFARCAFGFINDDCIDAQYSIFCYGSSNLFGCVGIRSGEWRILNKAYKEKDYKELTARIMESMRQAGEYGQYLPIALSPFAYNETIAQEYFPLNSNEAKAKGYAWKEPEKKEYQVTIKANALPEDINEVRDDITKEIIECEHLGSCREQCATAFRIIPEELQFYRQIKQSLPALCPNCRYHQRLKQGNPLKLWRRQCMCDHQVFKNTVKHQHHPEDRCPNEFETSYAPERPEIVYCAQCYQAEVA